MKSLLTVALIIFPIFCFAQAQNVFFLKNDGTLVVSKDSADYIRVISEPDKGSELFNVVEYYKSGKRKAVGKSVVMNSASFDGVKLTFFENGRRKSTETFDKGVLTGESDDYFPNGKLYLHKKHIITETPQPETKWPLRKSEFTITEGYDSTGVKQITDGNGILKIYNSSFTAVSEEGSVKNGKREGEWSGRDELNNATFKETYSNGELVAGSANFNGITSTYTKNRFTNPEFPDGDMGFGRFLVRTVRYPADAREQNKTGIVISGFTITKAGDVADIEVIFSAGKSLDDEAVRSIKMSPKWKPATKYGQQVSAKYNVPLTFNLQTN
ncbi:TonB family protein [Mucilaginibacter sp. 21P]|uniref:energy transducer TonB n=1 Tax=Mucilaginibacter sp. 21P TaxID=2778902 RepID=UPI001C56CD61|nr:energy transducer TonB [Mucilaginibacter sp. 21P]QXV66366.1 TonB family protein [Mucilaginibacter sp. 21P]